MEGCRIFGTPLAPWAVLAGQIKALASWKAFVRRPSGVLRKRNHTVRGARLPFRVFGRLCEKRRAHFPGLGKSAAGENAAGRSRAGQSRKPDSFVPRRGRR